MISHIGRRWARVGSVLVAATLWLVGCDGDGILNDGAPSPPPLTVSDPVTGASGTAAAGGLGFSGLAGSDDVVYVSMAPGTVAGGVAASIRNDRTGATAVVTMADGGFDPVAIEASPGDTLMIDIELPGGESSLVLTRVVPGARRPIVVRTQPPPGKRDVPLSAAVLVVFSEPIDEGTVTHANVQLVRRDGTRVSGDLRFLGADHLAVAFLPAAPLARGAPYQLVVTSRIGDLDGEALAHLISVEFTTDTATPTVASISVTPESVAVWQGDTVSFTAAPRDSSGAPLFGRSVQWTSSDEAVAIVDSLTGRVAAIAPGSATVTAHSEGQAGSATITVSDSTNVPRILVDASRDGGAWWYPQWVGEGGFDRSLPHQGKALADFIRSRGYRVTELPRPFLITGELLQQFVLVIRAGVFGPYSSAEVTAYEAYVESGGKLLLLADHMMQFAGPADSVGLRFGVSFAGVTRGDNLIETFAAHPITDGVEPLRYGVGSGLLSYPSSAQLLALLSAGSYLDRNNNDTQDAGEPSAPGVLGAMTHGTGRIVFCGDTNFWESVPEPLVRNVLAWLLGG
jgi:Big-like domain-containing protein